MRPSRINSEKGAIWCLFLLSLATTEIFAQTASTACSNRSFDETARVSSVHDGDTVRLNDGRKIRLIGINAPELERDNKPAQAFATEARDRLAHQISKHDHRIKLVYGKQLHDKYRRTLAHLFLPDGQNLQADLIQQGLAIAHTYPPNDAFSDCYHRLEKMVRCKAGGIWSEDSYMAKSSKQLNEDTKGFHILDTQIQRISQSGKTIHLFLEGGVLAGIKEPEMPYFDKNWLKSLLNKPITIRGWLYPKKQAKNAVKFYMQIKHPSVINLPLDKNNTSNCPISR